MKLVRGVFLQFTAVTVCTLDIPVTPVFPG